MDTCSACCSCQHGMFLFVAMTLTCFVHVYSFFGYLVFYQKIVLFGVVSLARCFGLKCFWCYTFVWTFWCPSWCFMNVTIIFGVIASFGQMLLGNQPYH